MDHRVTAPANIDLVAEANHRVANSLALLGSLVRMQARAVGKTHLPHSNAGVPVDLGVSCEAREDGTLQISVSDDGIGLPEGFNPNRDGGIGFQIIRALSTDIGAGLVIQSDNLGVTFSLTVPAALVANVKT